MGPTRRVSGLERLRQGDPDPPWVSSRAGAPDGVGGIDLGRNVDDKSDLLRQEIVKYDHLFATNERYNANEQHPRYDIAAKFIERCGDVHLVADIGAGRGLFLERLQKKGYEVFGVEPSRVAVETLKSPFVVLGTCSAIPYASDLFDVVVCLDVLEHIPSTLTRDSLRELSRVTKAYAIISVADHEDVVDDLVLHINLRSYPEWERAIADCFDILDGELLRSKTYPDRTAMVYLCRKSGSSALER